ncbi:hypothetical protein CRG98_028150 [Punica granatum]|uniref:Trichome birefringence-like C-terminal domain-containing protein n=1 Tax=Punica granatum TaxID=22663 RepID=A0A2I0J5E0_PUNGR|nr:hypothetical protein CRG98_028150 [Punica granatum]
MDAASVTENPALVGLGICRGSPAPQPLGRGSWHVRSTADLTRRGGGWEALTPPVTLPGGRGAQRVLPTKIWPKGDRVFIDRTQLLRTINHSLRCRAKPAGCRLTWMCDGLPGLRRTNRSTNLKTEDRQQHPKKKKKRRTRLTQMEDKPLSTLQRGVALRGSIRRSFYSLMALLVAALIYVGALLGFFGFVLMLKLKGRFNATALLERLRNKGMVFVGDSIQRGQWVSIVCLVEAAIPSDSLKSLSFHHNGSLMVFKAKVCTYHMLVRIPEPEYIPRMIFGVSRSRQVA